MQKFSAIRNVIPQATINNLHDRTLAIVEDLRTTYFPDLSDQDVLENYMHSKPSRFSRAVALRLMDSQTIAVIQPDLTSAANGFWGEKDYVFYPVFYVRLSPCHTPGTHLLDSQPHYDKSFGCYAYSFWMPLQTSNEETGGICLYPDEDVAREYVRRNENNRNDFLSYRDNSADLDQPLRGNAKVFSLEPGDVVTFDSDMLHGATRPGTRNRISFDVRLLSLAEQPEDSCPSRLINLFNSHIDLSNALNLMSLGDPDGAAMALQKVDEAALPDQMASVLTAFRARTNFPNPKDLFDASPWQSEYAWFQALPDDDGQ